jgi:hypothetical protein
MKLCASRRKCGAIRRGSFSQPEMRSTYDHISRSDMVEGLSKETGDETRTILCLQHTVSHLQGAVGSVLTTQSEHRTRIWSSRFQRIFSHRYRFLIFAWIVCWIRSIAVENRGWLYCRVHLVVATTVKLPVPKATSREQASFFTQFSNRFDR